MPKITVPTDSAGLEQFLSVKSNVDAVFSAEAYADGTNREFIDAYAKVYLKKGGGEELRTQVQAELFNILRDGKDSKAAEALGAGKVAFINGRPTVIGSDGTSLVTRGRGAAYNKAAPGAKMERAIPDADRFHSVGELCNAIRYLTSKQNGPGRGELLRKMDALLSFQNSFSSEDPGAGGFLIPETMRQDIYLLMLENSVVRNRASVIPMSTLSLRVPTVDDTSHVSSVYGGISFAWTEESAAITESTATFESVQLIAKKLAGYFVVPNELLNDAPAFSSFFDTQVPKGLAWFEDKAFFSESGTGAPQGFISCPASVSVAAESGQTTQTVIWDNVVKMYSRMLPTSLNNAVWIVAPDVFPQLATMALSVGTGGGPVWIGNYGGGSSGSDTPPASILGRPVIVSEKASALGTTGDISFVDLAYYLIGDRQAVEVASSEHFKFSTDQTAFRIIERIDGRPWLQSALTPANNSSNTLTAFVQLASR